MLKRLNQALHARRPTARRPIAGRLAVATLISTTSAYAHAHPHPDDNAALAQAIRDISALESVAEAHLKDIREVKRSLQQHQLEQLALEQKRTSGTDTYDRNAQKYQALIRERLSQAWILPATATPEMTATVKVALHPTGELAEATLVTTSGDSAYDTAALEAAHSLRRYPVPVDRETFNRYFRSFTVSFNPDRIK